MDNFLTELSSQGESLESDAEFTLDPLKQAERYATFQNDNSVYCLLRIFQGLTLAGARSVDIKVAKSNIEMEVTGCHADTKPETIMDGLHRAKRPPYLSHICTGVFSATHKSVGKLEIKLGNSTLRVEEGAFSIVTSVVRKQVLTVSLTYSKRGWLESGAKEQLELAKRLHHAQMTVTIDTRRVSMNAPSPQTERWYKKTTRAQMLARVLPAIPGDEPGLTPLQDDLFLSENDTGSRSFVLLDPTGTLYLDLAFEGAQNLVPILDGVAGTVVESDRTPGLQGCQHVKDPKTDLSGLTLSDEEPFLRHTEQRYHQILQTVLPHVSQLRAVWPKNFNLSNTLGSVACTGELALIAVPVTAVFGGAYQAFDNLSFRIQQKRQQETLVRETERKIRSLLGESESS